MKALLHWQRITRQGVHQAIRRGYQRRRDRLATLDLAQAVRREHPGMGCREMYYTAREHMPRGRDWCEQVMLADGFRLKRPTRSFTVAGREACSNLIEGKTIDGPNQVWQTDITYMRAAGRWYYLSFVVDVYTRQILAGHCSKDLSAASQVACLGKAVRSQKGRDLKGLIVHSDRGTQYTSGEFRKYLSDHGITQSMAYFGWQNAYSERINGTIKNNYLYPWRPDSFKSLKRAVAKAVRVYNKSKPHRNLPNRLAPDAFVAEISNGKFTDYTFNIWSKLTSTKKLNLN